MGEVTEIKKGLTGWNALDLDNPEYGLMRDEQNEQIKQINADMRELFLDSDLGRRVLDVLMGWTIKRAGIDPRGTERMDVWRGGQDDIVRCILKAIQASEES